MLQLFNITKSFDSHTVIEDISINFEPGKVHFIIGSSGSGKSVLLKCVVGLIKPNQGSVFFDDNDMITASIKTRKNILKDIGMLFQGSALFDSMNVEENILFPLNMFSKMTIPKKIERVNFCLSRVNLPGINNLAMSELSGGMKKRVGIARAIAMNPKYLFCDEPNSGLDPQTAIVIDKLIKEITNEFNMTTLVVSHDMNSVMEIGDHIMYLYKGKKWWEGTKMEIMNSGNTALDAFIFAGKFQKHIIEEKSKEQTNYTQTE